MYVDRHALEYICACMSINIHIRHTGICKYPHIMDACKYETMYWCIDVCRQTSTYLYTYMHAKYMCIYICICV